MTYNPSARQQVHITGVDNHLHADFASYCRLRKITMSEMLSDLLALAVRNPHIMQQAISAAPPASPVLTAAHLVAHEVTAAIWQSFRAQSRAYRMSPQSAARGLLVVFAEEPDRLEGLMGR